MKTPTNLVLSRAETIASTDNPLDAAEAAKPVTDEVSNDPNVPDSLEAITNDASEAQASQTAGEMEDGSKLYGTVVKSWTSAGVAGTGALSARIVATYPVIKDTVTGIVDFVGSTFEVSFTDIDNNTTSTIPSYAFAFTGVTQIPQPEDGGEFQICGAVNILARPSGRLFSVNFNMSGGASEGSGGTPTDIGSIFELDIPGDTEFAPKDSTSTG